MRLWIEMTLPEVASCLFRVVPIYPETTQTPMDIICEIQTPSAVHWFEPT